jgi:hypothetical protein
MGVNYTAALTQERGGSAFDDGVTWNEDGVIFEDSTTPLLGSEAAGKFFSVPIRRLWAALAVIVSVWVGAGTGFFMYMEGWNFANAFFFTINVGLGVGTGATALLCSARLPVYATPVDRLCLDRLRLPDRCPPVQQVLHHGE